MPSSVYHFPDSQWPKMCVASSHTLGLPDFLHLDQADVWKNPRASFQIGVIRFCLENDLHIPRKKYLGGMGTEADECQDHILSGNGPYAQISERELSPKRNVIFRKPPASNGGFCPKAKERLRIKTSQKALPDLQQANCVYFSGHEI